MGIMRIWIVVESVHRPFGSSVLANNLLRPFAGIQVLVTTQYCRLDGYRWQRYA